MDKITVYGETAPSSGTFLCQLQCVEDRCNAVIHPAGIVLTRGQLARQLEALKNHQGFRCASHRETNRSATMVCS